MIDPTVGKGDKNARDEITAAQPFVSVLLVTVCNCFRSETAAFRND